MISDKVEEIFLRKYLFQFCAILRTRLVLKTTFVLPRLCGALMPSLERGPFPWIHAFSDGWRPNPGVGFLILNYLISKIFLTSSGSPKCLK